MSRAAKRSQCASPMRLKGRPQPPDIQAHDDASCKVSGFVTSDLEPDMRVPHAKAERPREVISLTSYEQLDLYLAKFFVGDVGLVLLLGRHGTGKSETVRRMLSLSLNSESTDIESAESALYIEGHMQWPASR